MRNEKKIKELTPKMTIIYYRDNEKKRTKKQLDPPCKSQAIMVE